MTKEMADIIGMAGIVLTSLIFCGYLLYSIMDLRKERVKNQSLASR